MIKENNQVAPETPKLKGEGLLKELAITATRIGRASRRATGEKLSKLNIALGLLNHAQALVDIHPSRARQLLALARKHFN